MIAALILWASMTAAASGAGDVGYIDASLEFEGDLLSQHFTDIEGKGMQSLCVGLRRADGQRELRIFRLTKQGLSASPKYSVPVLEDVIAYGFADVRQEPGQELIFLTRSGAWSYSLTLEGYRGNIARLVEAELLYDVPDSHSLPYWHYTLPAEGGDQLLLPLNESYGIWGPRPADAKVEAGSANYEERASFWSQKEEQRAAVRGDEVHLVVRGDSHVFLGDDGDGSALLRDYKSHSSPALMDVNGDGAKDLIAASSGELRVYLSENGRIASEASRVESYPDYLKVKGAKIELEFADLDGDERSDLLVVIEEEAEGLTNSERRLLFLVNDGERLLPEQPTQVLRFEAATLRRKVVDVNADGRPDLVLRKFEMPSLLGSVTGLEFKMTHMVYLAQKKGPALFERRPVLKHSQVFNENTVGAAIANRVLEFDCSGDGVPDLVEIDLQGRVVIRRLTHKSGFFSGDTWELDSNPWKRFETRGASLSIRVYDVNGDGLGDIVSPGERSLTLFLSRR